MSLKPSEDIPMEIHPENDQFFRIEKGNGILIIGKDEEQQYDFHDGSAFVIPANTWHRVVNTSSQEYLKLYTIYSPPHHPDGKIDITKPIETSNDIKQSGGKYYSTNNYQLAFSRYKKQNHLC